MGRGGLTSWALKCSLATEPTTNDKTMNARAMPTEARFSRIASVASGISSPPPQKRQRTKALEKEPPPPQTAPCETALPALVSPLATGPVAFLRCHTCQKRTHKAKVCGGCLAVCYCSVACQAADASHAAECEACKRHMATDVRVTLRGSPRWLHAAMGHRCVWLPLATAPGPAFTRHAGC